MSAPALAHPRGTELTGTLRLVRLAARRDRVLLPVWVAGLLALLGGTVASIVALYATEADRLVYATVAASNAIARAFDGPMAGTSLGAVSMTEAFGITALLTGIMSVQAVVRHTRLEEETGRAELIGSAIVGRHARLVAALLLVLAANLVLGAGAAAVLTATGLPGGSSLLVGATLVGVGLTFAGVGAVAAQIAGTARGANAIGVAVVGASFLLRAVGDASGRVDASGVVVVSAWPSWLSPIGWGQQVRLYHDDRVAVLGLFVAATVVLVALAFALSVRRDVGAGLRPVPPGPPMASRWLATLPGLVLRLHRPALIGWLVGFAVVAAALGGIVDEVEALIETSEELAAMIAQTGGSELLVELYLTFAVALLGLAVAAYGVQAVLRFRAEELSGRAEPLLATAVSRTALLGAHVGWAVVGAVLALAVIGLVGAGTAALVATVDVGASSWLLAAAVQLPAVLVLLGATVVLVGWVPRRASAIAWALVLASLVLGLFGELLELPAAVIELSPFAHVPAVPAEELRVVPLVVLTAVALVLAAVGLVGWRRRDIADG